MLLLQDWIIWTLLQYRDQVIQKKGHGLEKLSFKEDGYTVISETRMTVYPIRVWSNLGNSNECVSNTVFVFFKSIIDCNYNLFVKLSKL